MKHGRDARATLVLLLFVAFISVGSTSAQSAPSLSGMLPVYLRQGESREITLSGQNLAAATSVTMPQAAGVLADLLPAEKAGAPPRVKLSAAADARLGDRELRVITPTGVTAPLSVTVGQIPAVAEKEPNNTPDGAQPISLPAAITGRIDTAGDTDFFRFDAHKGQHLIFDVHALRLGSPLEAVLAVHDSSGRELSHADDEYHGGDPMLVFDVPADGPYLLEIRDLRYRGGQEYGYRIDAGALPYVESLTPMSGPAGQTIRITASGHNLEGGRQITLDLIGSQPGPMPVRAKTAAGFSNQLTFFVTPAAAAATPAPAAPTTKPSDSTTQPVASIPADVSGVVLHPADENLHRFRVATTQQVTLAIIARRAGSPLDALLTLKNGKGETIEQSNGPGGDAEARISRSLNAGEYIAAVRDLTYAGGPSYAYRLTIDTAAPAPDFAVRLMPDAVRVPRGGNAKLWCEVTRAGGLRGPVTLSIDGLPAGVAAPAPITLEESTSGIFVLSAAPEAALGTYPVRITAAAAAAAAAGAHLARTAEPELNGRIVRQAYVTITEPAPLGVDAVALTRPDQLRDYNRQVADLQAKLAAPDPKVDASQAAWEKGFAGPPAGHDRWQTLEPQKLTSAGGVTLSKNDDGTIVASGADPERDTYTIVVAPPTDLKAIAAIRVEALADPSLPGNGPGRAANGNFVLKLAVSAAPPKSDPAKSAPLKFKSASATIEQGGFPAASAVGIGDGGGWAILPGVGASQSAAFVLAEPLKLEGEAGTILAFKLDYPFGGQHTLGRLRLSATADARAAAAPPTATSIPAAIVAIARTPADQRTAEQKAKLSDYFRRNVSPELAAERAKLDALRQAIGPLAEIARLEDLLATNTPQLDAERLAWEKTALTGGWLLADVTASKGEKGTALARQPDGSIFASGENPPTETYTITANTSLKHLAAVRLEALPDDRLPAGGPGRAPDGNFVLTGFKVSATPRASKSTTKPARIDIPFATARADFEQQNFPVSAAIDDKPETGWAVSPNMARPLSATFAPRSPVDLGDAGATLTFALEHASTAIPHYTLGRFRLWVTESSEPRTALPAEIVAILKLAPEKRNEDQKGELAAWYRSIAPSLDGVRQRIAELKLRGLPLPLTVARNRALLIPVPIERNPGFGGDVTITLEGFSSGRDPATRQPMPITRNFQVAPLTIKGSDAFGKLNVRANGNSEIGTRLVVLRAETKVGNDTWIQYSPAFPLTVTEK